jgi:SAM-dependent methyltransferase
MSFFDFGENNTRTLFNFLQEALAKNNEFEIRFGKFYQNKSNRTSFDSNVDIENFYSLKRMFDGQKIQKNIKNTKEFIYKRDRASVKRIIDLSDNSETVMLKQNLRNYDIYDYDLRMSVSFERTNGIKIENGERYELVRNKSRTSYILPFGSFDLSIVVQEDKFNKIQTKYEVEMEINKMQSELIMQYLMVILQNRQENFYVIPGNERRRVVSEYRDLVKNNYFIGAQPETLHKEKISNLYKQQYSVTDKADGDRAFMFIDKVGSVYFIDNNLNKIYKTNVKSCKQNEDQNDTNSECSDGSLYYSTIIDGELVRHNNQIHFLSFDCLFYNGKDLRGQSKYDLKTRLNRLNHIVKTLSESQFYKISVKHYYFGNVFSGSKHILDSVSEKFYENDGLIFTPVNEPYPLVKKWVGLLKWKPAELNTIDFYAVKMSNVEDGTFKWQLYVQGEVPKSNEYEKNKTTTVLFDIQKLCGQNTESRLVTYETSFSDSLIDPTTDESYKTNTVIEFRWDSNQLMFVPLRTRWDKTVNPRKHGNFSKVACDIWNNINNPVEKDYLLKFYTNSKNNSSEKNGDFFFETMRRFHNKVKEYLYNKYAKNAGFLLELCSGKGGDMHKWVFNNIKNVYGYDISERNIAECKRRFAQLQLQTKTNFDYNFSKLDLTRDDGYEIIYKNTCTSSSVNCQEGTKFDVVCCQFGIHYFFESEKSVENIVKILETSLKNSGYFIVTFMDNKQLDKLFGQRDIVSYEEDGEIIYLLEKTLNPGSVYGNRLKITLNGNNILGEGSDEWIIDFDNFKAIMGEKGYTCVETELFENLYNPEISGMEFKRCERDISFLNRYCVFQKNNNQENNLQKQFIPHIEQNFDISGLTQFNFETIDLHQKNTSVYKINSLYNIIDMINCIEYKYYKNCIQDESLDDTPDKTFPRIQKIFDDLNINYIPIFIKDPLDFSEYFIGKKNLYFTYHRHVVERRVQNQAESNIETEMEQLEYNNWYIIMHNECLLFDKPKSTENIIETENQIESETPIESKIPIESEMPIESETPVESEKSLDKKKLIYEKYNGLLQSNTKMTIKIIKELLEEIGLKTYGKKEELQKRLEEYFTS